MAYANSGGTLTVPAASANLVDLLVTAGLLTAKSAFDRGVRPHYSYHSITFTVDAGNTGDLFFGHSAAVTNAPSTAVTLRLPKTAAPYTQQAVEGMGAVESWWVASANGTEKLYVEILE